MLMSPFIDSHLRKRFIPKSDQIRRFQAVLQCIWFLPGGPQFAVCRQFSDLRYTARIRSRCESRWCQRLTGAWGWTTSFQDSVAYYLESIQHMTTWFAKLRYAREIFHMSWLDQLSSFKFSNFAHPAKVQSMAWLRTALLRIAAIVLVVGHASPLLTGLILLALGLWAVRLHPRKTLDMSPLAVFSFGTLWMLPGLGEGFVWSTQEYNVLNEENASKVG